MTTSASVKLAKLVVENARVLDHIDLDEVSEMIRLAEEVVAVDAILDSSQSLGATIRRLIHSSLRDIEYQWKVLTDLEKNAFAGPSTFELLLEYLAMHPEDVPPDQRVTLATAIRAGVQL